MQLYTCCLAFLHMQSQSQTQKPVSTASHTTAHHADWCLYSQMGNQITKSAGTITHSKALMITALSYARRQQTYCTHTPRHPQTQRQSVRVFDMFDGHQCSTVSRFCRLCCCTSSNSSTLQKPCMMQLHAMLRSCKNPKPACFLVSQRTLERQCLLKQLFWHAVVLGQEKHSHAGLTSV